MRSACMLLSCVRVQAKGAGGRGGGRTDLSSHLQTHVRTYHQCAHMSQFHVYAHVLTQADVKDGYADITVTTADGVQVASSN